MTKGYCHNPPKLELPIFVGDDPRVWLRKCPKFFNVYQIPTQAWIDTIEMYLEGKAEVWFQGLKLVR